MRGRLDIRNRICDKKSTLLLKIKIRFRHVRKTKWDV